MKTAKTAFFFFLHWLYFALPLPVLRVLTLQSNLPCLHTELIHLLQRCSPILHQPAMTSHQGPTSRVQPATRGAPCRTPPRLGGMRCPVVVTQTGSVSTILFFSAGSHSTHVAHCSDSRIQFKQSDSLKIARAPTPEPRSLAPLHTLAATSLRKPTNQPTKRKLLHLPTLPSWCLLHILSTLHQTLQSLPAYRIWARLIRLLSPTGASKQIKN